jgi:hypothetical protein
MASRKQVALQTLQVLRAQQPCEISRRNISGLELLRRGNARVTPRHPDPAWPVSDHDTLLEMSLSRWTQGPGGTCKNFLRREAATGAAGFLC